MGGLPWIKVWTVVGQHPKVQRLEREMDIPDALGMVIRLWCWVADYHPDGDIPEADAESMASAVTLKRCVGVAAEFVTRACVTAGFLDRIPGGFRVHDWAEMQTAHIDSAERKKEQARERQRKFRSKRSVTDKRYVTRDVTRDSVTEKEREKEKEIENKKQQHGGLPLKSELVGGSYPGCSALKLRLAEDGLDLAWPAHDKRQAIESAVSRVGLDACVAACLSDAGGMKSTPKSLGIFAPTLSRLQQAKPTPVHDSSPWWERMTPDAAERFRRERLAIDPGLDGAPPSAPGAANPEAVRALIAKYQQESRQ
jgi:hypothetical protein